MLGHKVRDSGHRKYIQYDRSDDISHIAYYFQIWKDHDSNKSRLIFTRNSIIIMGKP